MTTSLTFDIIARDRASDKFDKVGDSAARSSDKLKRFAKVGGAALAAGAIVVGKFAIDAIGSASDLSETLNKSNVVFGKHSKGVEKWADSASSAFGLSKGAALGAASQFGDMFSQLGASKGEAAATSKNIVKLATDLGSFHNLETGDVLDKISGALRGEYDSIQKIVPALSDARVKQEALAATGKKSVDQLTEQDKATAALALITKDSGNALNDFSETSDGLANRQKILKAKFEDTKAAIGEKLLPVATKFFGFLLDKGVPAIQKLGDWFMQKLMPPLRDFAEDMAPKAHKAMAAIKDAFEDSKPFLELAGKVLTNVVVPGLKMLAEIVAEQLIARIKVMGKTLEFVGKMGTWMWNNALQPAFKFLATGIGKVLDGFEAMLGALSKVPGFGWAKDAAVAMGKAADKAYAVADGLKKIPPKKTVYVAVKYTYHGLRNGTGSTRGGDPNDPASYLPRMKATAQSAAADLMTAIGKGIQDGGKKLDKVLEASRDRIKTKLSQIRSDMASMSESIASALNPTDFGGGLTELMASLTGNNGALSGLTAVFDKLKGSVSKGFLSSLMQSGNATLATQLANDPTAAANASALFDSNAAMASSLGDQTAQAVLGDKIVGALKDEIGKLRDQLKDSPGKTARELARELKDLKIVVEGLSAGQRAHIRGAGGF